MAIALNDEQLNTIIAISKDLQERIKCNGMPELDQEVAEMIELLEGAVEPPAPLAIDSLDPAAMAVPGPDASIMVLGSGFTSASIINWNGGDEPTEFVSEGKLRTLVKVSLVEAPLPFELPIYVHNGEVKSNTVTFTFESDIVREMHKRKRR